MIKRHFFSYVTQLISHTELLDIAKSRQAKFTPGKSRHVWA